MTTSLKDKKLWSFVSIVVVFSTSDSISMDLLEVKGS